MSDSKSSEWSFLIGLVELTWDNPDEARHRCQWVRHEDFADDGCRSAFRLLDDTLSTVEAPKAPDLQRHELWPDCRDTIADAIAEAAHAGKGYALGMERWARLIRDAATRRRVSDAVHDLEEVSRSRGSSSAELLQAAEAVKEAAQAVEGGDVPTTLSDAIGEYLRNESTPKIETGFAPLDRVTGGGLPVGGLAVFAAPPSVGKSALALQACLGAMDFDRNLRVVWCLGEMTFDAFARRAVCHWSTRYGQHPVSMGSAERRSDFAQGSARTLAELIGPRMTIVKPPLAIGAIEDAVISSRARLVVIDYVQLVEMEAQSRREEIDGVVKRIRRLTLEHNAALIAISNVAKTVQADTRIGAIGKESSELDFAADLFLLGIPDEQQEADGFRLVRWATKKNRHGPCEDLLTRFDGGLQTFYDAEIAPVDDFANWR